MNKRTQLLLSLPSLIGLSYMFTYMFPEKFVWLIPNMRTYYILTISVQFLAIFQIVYLIIRLWSFKKLPKDLKTNWTILLILFGAISSLVYIWKKDKQFKALNKKSTMA